MSTLAWIVANVALGFLCSQFGYRRGWSWPQTVIFMVGVAAVASGIRILGN